MFFSKAQRPFYRYFTALSHRWRRVGFVVSAPPLIIASVLAASTIYSSSPSATDSGDKLSASASREQRINRRKRYRLRIQAAAIPKQADSEEDIRAPRADGPYLSGEDAFCFYAGMSVENSEDGMDDAEVVDRNNTSVYWMAVADGVGGWNKRGIDPSRFSSSLVRHLYTVAADSSTHCHLRGHDYQSSVNPRWTLHEAYQRLLDDWRMKLDEPFGSSTACVVAMQSDGMVHACNLGDSGFLIIRPAALSPSKTLSENRELEGEDSASALAASIPQQHRFNTPYQLKLTPQGEHHDVTPLADFSLHSVCPLRWPPSSLLGKQARLLREGDVIVVASDGLFDNLYMAEIVDEVNRQHLRRSIKSSDDADDELKGTSLAMRLALKAYEASLDAQRNTPFSDEYNKQGLKEKRSGGKPDDITVLVGIIECS